MEPERPGKEIDKEYADVVNFLIDTHGWRYRLPTGGGYPRLLPADKAKPAICAETGHTRGHAFGNWIGLVRRAGGHWPPGRQ